MNSYYYSDYDDDQVDDDQVVGVCSSGLIPKLHPDETQTVS